ncbi:uncharacterized protein E5676_scaffold120G001840 [Cucumis melo var. makuwa]|uniref:Envelope-like protein n=1 Tax=Cucumis melo var. makuwa TaxID=1194695 RepID=A0A5A7UKN9_CUCMM|nr:uncharacterized protein E6C27_scaffold186G002350 [Cucumis melo var. makuwa]TYK29064.1 uncharacterized protein E5676_scaffold120G001840 [Cucumis melo var. makuwa]
MRDRRFKSTPTRRPYRLPSEKSQVNISKSSPLSVQDEHIVDSAVEDVEIALGVFESHISEMDLDERDDVSLARLLKKWLFSNVDPYVADVPITSAHSDESSSSEDIFVPTLGRPSPINEEVGQSGGFSLVRSSVRVGSSVEDQHSVPNSDLVDDSTDNLGGNIVDLANENPAAHADSHVESTDNCAPENDEQNMTDVPQTET